MKERQVNYKKASTYYLVGNLFNKGMAFITVPIFTRILSTSDYGLVTTYNSWVSILSMVIGFALHMGIRAAFLDYREKIDDFMSVTTTFTLECGLILGAMASAVALLYRIDIGFTLIILCCFQGLSAALVQNYSMYLMMRYQYKFRTLLMVLPNIISVVLSVLAIKFICHTDLYLGRIIPTAAVNILFGVIVLILIYRRSRVLHHKEFLKYALKISAPLVLHGIALNILSQSDRMMITWLADSSQTGIYSLIYNFSMIATVITTGLEGVWVPWFMDKLSKQEREDINRRAKDYINLMTYAMIAVILVGPEVVKILASEKYWEGICIIPPIVLANYMIFAYTLYVNIEHFYKKTTFITINTIIAATSNIILNFLLIPRFGYIAAAFTTLVSYIIAFVLHARYAKALEPDVYPLSTFIRPLIHISAAVAFFYCFIDSWFARWFVMVLYLVAMLINERERIKEYFPTIQSRFARR